MEMGVKYDVWILAWSVNQNSGVWWGVGHAPSLQYHHSDIIVTATTALVTVIQSPSVCKAVSLAQRALVKKGIYHFKEWPQAVDWIIRKSTMGILSPFISPSLRLSYHGPGNMTAHSSWLTSHDQVQNPRKEVHWLFWVNPQSDQRKEIRNITAKRLLVGVGEGWGTEK